MCTILNKKKYFILQYGCVADPYRCKCNVNTLIQCKTNATVDDLCHECQLTKCGATVFIAYFHYYKNAPCMAHNVTKCCPHVNTVVIDDEALCDCYCNMTGVTIVPSPQVKPFECSW